MSLLILIVFVYVRIRPNDLPLMFYSALDALESSILPMILDDA